MSTIRTYIIDTATEALRVLALAAVALAAHAAPYVPKDDSVVLEPWWDLPAPPLDALVMRAILKQYSHDFNGAMQDLKAATREDPGNARAWSWRAAIDMVQADYDQARRDCLALKGISDDLYAAGCLAFLDSTTG